MCWVCHLCLFYIYDTTFDVLTTSSDFVQVGTAISFATRIVGSLFSHLWALHATITWSCCFQYLFQLLQLVQSTQVLFGVPWGKYTKHGSVPTLRSMWFNYSQVLDDPESNSSVQIPHVFEKRNFALNFNHLFCYHFYIVDSKRLMPNFH